MSCFDCRFYTGEDYLACGVDPITAANSPELGCRDWQPTQLEEQYWELLVNPPHVDAEQIGWVPVDGWKQLVCELFVVFDEEDELEIALALSDYEAGDFVTFEEYDANRIS